MRISVVIPLFNKEKSIQSTISSVLLQTYSDFEIIIVDDGSTDNSYYIASEIVDSRIRIFRKNNGGVSDARNFGINVSSGEYIAFLDADDLWEPHYLEQIVRLINDYPQAGIYETAHYILKGSQKAIDHSSFPDSFRGLVDNPWKQELYCWTSSTVIRKSVIEDVGGFDERMCYGEDIDLWWRILLKYYCALYNSPLAVYNTNSENRAMERSMPFSKHLPYYFEKFVEAKLNNPDFCFYADRECLYRLFPYTSDYRNRKDVKRVLKLIDFSKQKRSMRLRFFCPSFYRLYRTLTGNNQ